MECQTSDSKKLFKVFDASKRKSGKKKGYDDSNSVATDESNNEVSKTGTILLASAKTSLQALAKGQDEKPPEASCSKRERSPSATRSPGGDAYHNRGSRSPHHHRRHQLPSNCERSKHWSSGHPDVQRRDGISLALKPGHVSTPRSTSPLHDMSAFQEIENQDKDSIIYAFLEEAIKRDKKKHRQKHERERERDRERDVSVSHDRHHRHSHRHEEVTIRDRDKHSKEYSPISPILNQAALFKTFAEFCAQMSKTTTQPEEVKEVTAPLRTLSHKSLQCDVTRGNSHDIEQRPVRLGGHEHSWENIPSMRGRNQGNKHESRAHTPEITVMNTSVDHRATYYQPYDKAAQKYPSKFEFNDDRYHEYVTEAVPTRSCVMEPSYRSRAPPPERRDYKEYDERREPRMRHYEDDRRRSFEQKTSRSFDAQRDVYVDDDRGRQTTRSDPHRKRYEEPRDVKRYEEHRSVKRFDERSIRDRRYDERKEKYYDDKQLERDRQSNLLSKERRSKRTLERLERNSVASRDEDFKDRDRYSERERDSGLSIADGENSTVSGRSNCLRVVKQEIAEQREAMDKMMKLWKELMRCFKGVSQNQEQRNKTNEQNMESAANVQESAAAQLRLWRECMRRYETVARDVGDTDARLKEEINKQRSEMAEMANMWQECLQRYREMSNDFNELKDKLAKSESPSRAPPQPLICAEGEGSIPVTPYRLPPNYMQVPPAYGGGSPLRSRASAPPPAWWWGGEPQPPQRSPRRRSSPDSRGSHDCDRDHRHRHKERDDSRYKEKPKPSAARSEHRHRKR